MTELTGFATRGVDVMQALCRGARAQQANRPEHIAGYTETAPNVARRGGRL